MLGDELVCHLQILCDEICLGRLSDAGQLLHAVVEVEALLNLLVVVLSEVRQSVHDLPGGASVVREVVNSKALCESVADNGLVHVCCIVEHSSVGACHVREQLVEDSVDLGAGDLHLEHLLSSTIQAVDSSANRLLELDGHRLVDAEIICDRDSQLVGAVAERSRQCVLTYNTYRSVEDCDLTVGSEMVVEDNEVMVYIVVNDFESAVDLEAAEYGFSASQAGGGLNLKITADHSVEGVERIAVLNDLRMAVVYNAEYLIVVLSINSMVAVDLIVKICLHRLCAYFPAEGGTVDDLF